MPPLITNIKPRTIGLRSNCLKWGSRVACKNPMLMLVAIMEDVAINTPGILKAFFTPGKIFFISCGR